MITDVKQSFLTMTENMQHCQRNFDLSKTIDDETIDWLYNIGYNTPTKQNLNSFQIVAFKSRNLILEIAKTATSVYDRWDSVPDDLKNEIISGKRMQNPQVNANLLFMFFHIPESRTSELRIRREGPTGDSPEFWHSATNFEMGLSASAVAIAAHSIGLKTGFCRCFNRDLLDKIINPYGFSSDDFSVALGIGYPIEGLPYYVHTDRTNESVTFVKEEFTKVIL